MEKNKYICPQCGSIMIENYEKPALNLSCPKCGCKIATTRWDDIDLDDTNYMLIIKPSNDANINKIKFIAKTTGLNFIQSKELIFKGGLLATYKATEMKDIVDKLKIQKIKYEINPNFPW